MNENIYDINKDNLEEFFSDIPEFKMRLEIAMVTMDRMRCPLRMADPTLYQEMRDSVDGWCMDYDLDPDDYDIDEMIF